MKSILKNRVIYILLVLFMCIFPIRVSAAAEATAAEDNGGPAEEEISGTQDNQKVKSAVESRIKSSGNNYPIVLVHGFLGWGDDDKVLGKSYWGWDNSLREMLNKDGYEVYAPSVGPVSSNWDRACELYAYLVGGTVDYGEVHSGKYGHSRYGRTFPGVMKDLGKRDKNGQIKKVHLIGHSMGGETSRVLAQLLENGSAEEAAKTGKNTSPLFKGGKHWIESITTISTPHDGNQQVQDDTEYYFHKFTTYIAAQCGGINEKRINYDFKLDQWGLKRNPGESAQSYIKRVLTSPILNADNKDISTWDLSLSGASELNSFAKAQSDIYYFSIACSDTHKSLFSKYQVPNCNMNPLLIGSAVNMGKFTQRGPGKITVDSSWWESDGFVSVRSSMGPHEGSADKITEFNGTPKKGVWNYLGKVNNVDHLEVIFLMQPWHKAYLQNEYRTWAKMLSQL